MTPTSIEVDRYIAAQPAAARTALAMVRQAIRKALPVAEEVISYQIPAYRVEGRVAIFFAGWKAHVALYPATAVVVATFADELVGYQVSKGTIRFPLSAKVPSRLIQRIAALRGKETRALAAATNAKKAARSTKTAKSATVEARAETAATAKGAPKTQTAKGIPKRAATTTARRLNGTRGTRSR